MVSLKSLPELMLFDLCVSVVVKQMESSSHCLQVDSDLCEAWKDEHVHIRAQPQLGFHLSSVLIPGSEVKCMDNYIVSQILS